MNPKLSLIVTLVMLNQFTQIHASSTTQNRLKNSSLKINSHDSERTSFFPHLYVFGGRDGNHTLLDNASRLKLTSGEWQTMNNMPTARSEFCGAVVDKQIYQFGGFRGKLGSFQMQSTVDVYDCFADTYTLLRDMPSVRVQCGAAALEDSVYVAGGTVTSDYLAVSSVIKYDIQTDRWSTVRSMNTPRSGHQLVELNELLYAIGGYGQPWLNTVEVYNPSTDRWSFVASTQYTHKENFGATVHDGKIYVLSSNGFEVYSPGTNRWTSLDSLTNYYNCLYVSLVSMHDNLWAVGGQHTTNGISKRFHSFDPITGRWSKHRDMDVARMFQTAFVVDQ